MPPKTAEDAFILRAQMQEPEIGSLYSGEVSRRRSGIHGIVETAKGRQDTVLISAYYGTLIMKCLSLCRRTG